MRTVIRTLLTETLGLIFLNLVCFSRNTPRSLDTHNSILDCEPYKELVTDLPKEIPDIRQQLQRAGMKKKNRSGNDYYEVHFDIGMEFDNEIKFYLIFEGGCD